MCKPEPRPASHLDRPAPRVAVAATFTAEPLAEAPEFRMGELELPATIEFAPYDQVFQELPDPARSLSRNYAGIDVVLVRPEDWLRSLPGSDAGALSDAGGLSSGPRPTRSTRPGGWRRVRPRR